jgi:hypothetical protein
VAGGATLRSWKGHRSALPKIFTEGSDLMLGADADAHNWASCQPYMAVKNVTGLTCW